jgi:hypothetical protein
MLAFEGGDGPALADAMPRNLTVARRKLTNCGIVIGVPAPEWVFSIRRFMDSE